MGVHWRNYQKWELGTTAPNPHAAFQLCNMLIEIDGKIEGKWYKS
ncbi:MAG: hypothetical protein AB1489_34450 [Acidobacteriota bacterium]